MSVAILTPEPDRFSRSSQQLHDFLHVPGFASVAAALYWAFPDRRAASTGRRGVRIAAVALASVALGIFVELMQRALGGVADPWDVLHDVGGVAAAAILAASLWPNLSAGRRWALRVAGIVVAVCFLPPTVRALADEHRAARSFPILADFRDAREVGRFTWSWCSASSRRGSTDAGLEFELQPGAYPGFALFYFPRDWRGWGRLVISCANLSEAPLTVTVRIDDMAHDESYDDRFNERYVLAPGPNEIGIPLDAVAAAPKGRRLDLSRVRTVSMFAAALKEPRRILLKSVRLDR